MRQTQSVTHVVKQSIVLKLDEYDVCVIGIMNIIGACTVHLQLDVSRAHYSISGYCNDSDYLGRVLISPTERITLKKHLRPLNVIWLSNPYFLRLI